MQFNVYVYRKNMYSFVRFWNCTALFYWSSPPPTPPPSPPKKEKKEEDKRENKIGLEGVNLCKSVRLFER